MRTVPLLRCVFMFLVAGAVMLAANSVIAQLGQCAVPIGPLRPDLIVDADELQHIKIKDETYAQTDCAVVEGCIPGAGTHTVLRFTSSTPNIGMADMFIGDPNLCPNLFQPSECHQHLHFREYADYRLWTVAGYQNWVANRDLTQPTNMGNNATLLANAIAARELLVGRKQGFCLIDLRRYRIPGVDSGSPTFRSCSGNQGIKVGWADAYDAKLDCQFIVIPNGLPEADYVLEDHVNPEHLLPESDFTNNSSAVQFHYRPRR